MLFPELKEKFEKGELEIVHKGHFPSYEKSELDNHASLYLKSDFKNPRSKSKELKKMDANDFLRRNTSHQCPGCGQHGRFELDIFGDKIVFKADWNETMPTCPIGGRIKIKTAEINMPSGELLFANYMGLYQGEVKSDKIIELPDDIQYSEEYNICNHLGRQNTMTYFAEHFDLGYGQMGNMSADVFLAEDGKAVYVLDANENMYLNEDITEGKTDEEIEKMYEEAHEKSDKQLAQYGKKIGQISMSVWRWECMDRKSFEKHLGPLEDKEVKDAKKERDVDCNDFLAMDVVPGKWNIEHYYDTVGEYRDGRINVYSKLSLIE